MKKSKNNKGFTLIELLAVIIILAIILLIAIPSVTKYINDSRKDGYVDTIRSIIRGATAISNSGKLDMFDTDTTYYIDSKCIKTENGVPRSPYGDFLKSYVVITYDEDGYNYYWTGMDTTKQGVKSIKIANDINKDDIVANITDIPNDIGIGERQYIVEFDENCQKVTRESNLASSSVPEEGGTPKVIPSNDCVFNGTMEAGVEYVNGQYTYKYKYKGKYSNEWQAIEEDGWGVKLTDNYSNTAINTKMCTSINGKPIVAASYMFNNTYATSIDLSSFETKNLIYTEYMFYNVPYQSELNLSGFNFNKVTSSNYMFYYSKFGKLNLSKASFNGLTSLSPMFSYATIDELDMSGTSFMNATSIGELFRNSSAKNIKLNNAKFNAATSAASLFVSNQTVETINLKGANFASATDMTAMFYQASNLKSVDISNMNMPNVKNVQAMFGYDSKLTKLDLTGFITENINNLSSMFTNCTGLTELVLDNWKLVDNVNVGGMLSNTNALNKISMKNWKIPTSFTNFLARVAGGKESIKTIDVTGWDLSRTISIDGLFADANGLTNIIGLDTWNTSNIKNMNQVFYKIYGLTSIDLSMWNTSSVTSMDNMFNSSYKLSTINLSNWNLTNLTSMRYMFYNCSRVETIILDNWNISNLPNALAGGQALQGTGALKKLSMKNWVLPTTMTNWLKRTWGAGPSLGELDVTGWNLSKTTSISGAFAQLTGLTKITGINTWRNTSNLTNLDELFYGCNHSNFTSINMSGLDTSNVTSMYLTFYNCSAITSLDLSSWNTSKVTYTGSMFQGMSRLKKVDLSGWDTSNLTYGNTSGMFYQDSSLTTIYVKNQAAKDLFDASPGKPSGATVTIK